MIRKLLATTAIIGLVAGGAFAQTSTTTTTTEPAPSTMAPAGTTAAPAAMKADGHLASNLIGETVYNGTGDKAENIGDVNDLVVDNEGKITALVIGVGGFLGLGEKDVAVDFASASWAEKDGDRWLVIPTTTDELKAQAAFDRSAYNPAPATAMNTTNPSATGTTATGTDTAMAPAGTTTTMQSTDNTTTAAIDRSTLNPLNAADLRAEELVGTTVYGANDENVGEIGDVALTTDGKVDAIIIDVGGFLGIGEKEVAVGMDNLAFMADKDGNRYLYTKFTKEQLEAQPAYDEGNYAQNRDSQRLVMPN